MYGPLPLTIETVLIVQASLIVVFNSAVWFLFLKRRNLRNKSNYFIASLSASHILIGLFGVPCYVSSRKKISTLVLCTEVFYYFLCSSILNLYLVTYERYLSIMKPLYYHRRMGNSFVITVICTAWMFPSIPITIDTLFRTKMKIHRFSLGYLVYHWIQTLTFLTIFLLLAAVNTAMFRVAKRQLQAIQAVQHVVNSAMHRRPSEQSSRREKRTTFFFVYIVTTFLVFWLPKIGCEVYELVHHKLLDHTDLEVITLCIALLNPIFDPLIYLFFKADFKKAMRKMFRKRYQLRARVSPIRNLSVANMTLTR